MTSTFSFPVLTMKSRVAISLSIIGFISLSACAASKPEEDHASVKNANEVSQDPAASLVRAPKTPDVPLLLKTTKKPPDLLATPIYRPADREPDPARNVFFHLGSAEVGEESLSTLKRIAQMLKENRREVITLVGSTDDLGSREYCIAISSKRIDAVELELLKLGVYPGQIRKRPKGYEAANRTICNSEVCRHNRRRVEILFAD